MQILCCNPKSRNSEITLDIPITQIVSYKENSKPAPEKIKLINNFPQNSFSINYTDNDHLPDITKDIPELHPIHSTESQNPQNDHNQSEIKQYTTSKQLHIAPCVLFPDLFVNNKKIYIDEFGLKSVPIERREKFTFFGVDPNQDLTLHQNDIIINLEMSNYSNINQTNSNNSTNAFNNKQLPLFYIYYEYKYRQFILRSLTNEVFFSVSVKHYKKVIIDVNKKYFFKMGKVILNFKVKNDPKTILLKIKKNDMIKENKSYSFEENKFPVSIGRVNCTVTLKCESLSKTHATIDYDKSNEKFYLIDNGSTNGTQMLLNEGKCVKIEGIMTFNIGPKQFTVEEIEM